MRIQEHLKLSQIRKHTKNNNASCLKSVRVSIKNDVVSSSLRTQINSKPSSPFEGGQGG